MVERQPKNERKKGSVSLKQQQPLILPLSHPLHRLDTDGLHPSNSFPIPFHFVRFSRFSTKRSTNYCILVPNLTLIILPYIFNDADLLLNNVFLSCVFVNCLLYSLFFTGTREKRNLGHRSDTTSRYTYTYFTSISTRLFHLFIQTYQTRCQYGSFDFASITATA